MYANNLRSEKAWMFKNKKLKKKNSLKNRD